MFHSYNQRVIERERNIHKYIIGLDQGDFKSVAEVLDLATDDPELERVILEVNEYMINEMGILE